MNLHEAARALGGEISGRQILAPGPLHSDDDRSMAVLFDPSAPDGFVVNSFAGDDPLTCKDYVRERLGLEPFKAIRNDTRPPRPHIDRPTPQSDDGALVMPIPSNAPPAPNGHPKLGTPSTTWTYRDEAGAALFYTLRFDPSDASKSFLPLTLWRQPDGSLAWRWKGATDPRPLYGLDRLAARPAAPVVICEGEKSADAAERLLSGFVAVTSLNGAKSAAKADWSPLRGRHVTIWPDADEPGAAYAQAVAELALAAGAAPVAIVTPPAGVSDGWDAADAESEGWTHDRAVALIAGATINTPKCSTTAQIPLPLFPPLPPAVPYPIDALGILSRAAKAIERKVQVPSAVAAQSVLAVAALAAQTHADVLLPYGQKRPLSLYFATVIGSGDRKSSADNEASWPISTREQALRESYRDEMKHWRVASAAWAAERKRIEGDRKLDYDARLDALTRLGDEPAKPLAPFLTTGDLTLEGLAKNWICAHPALGVFTAEGGTFTGGYGMSDDNRLRTAAALSEVWDGKPIKRIRALDGVSILPGRRLSLHVMIQPDASAGFLANPVLRDQGILSRVLVAAPESIAGTRLYRDVDPDDDAAIKAYGARILAMLETPAPMVEGSVNELAPRALPLSADAAETWKKFFDHVERQSGIGGDLDPIRDLASKAAEHAARIAGVLTVANELHAEEIGRAAMENAVELLNWYLAEARRLQSASRLDPKLLRAAALLDWLKGRESAEIAFREILQFGPGAIRTKEAAEEAIGILTAHNWTVETSKRPRAFRLVGRA